VARPQSTLPSYKCRYDSWRADEVARSLQSAVLHRPLKLELFPKLLFSQFVPRAIYMSPLARTYILKLYVAGNTPNSVRALRTLKAILEEEFKGVYALKVIDVLKNPQLAEEDKILATPTLAKVLPLPIRKIIGDLSDREKVLIGLDLLYEELEDGNFE
jgi:circadian clock protein KaiB